MSEEIIDAIEIISRVEKLHIKLLNIKVKIRKILFQ